MELGKERWYPCRGLSGTSNSFILGITGREYEHEYHGKNGAIGMCWGSGICRYGGITSAYRLRANAYGESQPVDSNDTAAGRAENRRVMATLKD